MKLLAWLVSGQHDREKKERGSATGFHSRSVESACQSHQFGGALVGCLREWLLFGWLSYQVDPVSGKTASEDAAELLGHWEFASTSVCTWKVVRTISDVLAISTGAWLPHNGSGRLWIPAPGVECRTGCAGQQESGQPSLLM